MPRVLVLPDAEHLDQTGFGDTLLDERVDPIHLADMASSEKFLERLEWAINGEPPRGKR